MTTQQFEGSIKLSLLNALEIFEDIIIWMMIGGKTRIKAHKRRKKTRRFARQLTRRDDKISNPSREGVTERSSSSPNQSLFYKLSLDSLSSKIEVHQFGRVAASYAYLKPMKMRYILVWLYISFLRFYIRKMYGKILKYL